MTLKEAVMLKWLEKQEKHHRALQSHLPEKLFADGMLQIKNFLSSKGWEGTYRYVLEWVDKTKSEKTVGSHLLHVFYIQIEEKMRSLDKMNEMLLNNELYKVV